MIESKPLEQPTTSASSQAHSTMSSEDIAKAAQRHNRKHAAQAHDKPKPRTCAQPDKKC